MTVIYTEQLRQSLHDFADTTDPVDVIVELGEVQTDLRDVVQLVADLRRRAVRQLRAEGWKLQEIADATGLTNPRISQIETGYNRKERAVRASER